MSGPAYLSENYDKRWPVLVDLTAGTGGSATNISLQLPTDWDYLWANIYDTSTAKDVVLTKSDGLVVPTYSLTVTGAIPAGENILLQAAALTWSNSAQMGVAWLYWDWNAGGTATDRTGSPSTSSQKTASMGLYVPASGDPVISPVASREQLQVVSKDPNETIRVWFDVTSLLSVRAQVHNTQMGGTGVDWIAFTVYDGGTGGTAQPTMIDADAHRYTLRGESHLIGCLVTAGTGGTTYLGVLKVALTDGRIVLMPFELQVSAITESA